MTSRRTFLNSCLLALGVRTAPKVAVAPVVPVLNTMRRGFLLRPPVNDLPMIDVPWIWLPGCKGGILRVSDTGETQWVYPES